MHQIATFWVIWNNLEFGAKTAKYARIPQFRTLEATLYMVDNWGENLEGRK